jgi:hypothetical protein
MNMKALNPILFITLVVGVAVSTVMLRNLNRSPVPSVASGGRGEGAEALSEDSSSIASHLGVTPARVLWRSVGERDAASVEIGSGISAPVSVPADEVLGTVNDRSLLLKDLVPLRSDERQQSMTSEEFHSRLQRAVEMEVTFQAAAAQGVGLAPAQRSRVETIAQKHQKSFRDQQGQGITWSSVTAAQVAFEQRYTSALLLQQNLIAREAGVAPSSDRALQARYEQARSDLLNRWKATSNIRLAIPGI